MAWDPVWEQIFTSQAWGRYPGEDVISTAEDELVELLGPWKINEVNLITRSLDAQRQVIREWVVEAEKACP